MTGILVPLNRRKDDTVPRTQLDTAAVAERLGVTRDTVRRYRVADRDRYGFPPPDGYLGRTPWWYVATIDRWVKARPGQGAGAGRPSKTEAAMRARAAKRKAKR